MPSSDSQNQAFGKKFIIAKIFVLENRKNWPGIPGGLSFFRFIADLSLPDIGDKSGGGLGTENLGEEFFGFEVLAEVLAEKVG